jgi:hypothetical protein
VTSTAIDPMIVSGEVVGIASEIGVAAEVDAERGATTGEGIDGMKVEEIELDLDLMRREYWSAMSAPTLTLFLMSPMLDRRESLFDSSDTLLRSHGVASLPHLALPFSVLSFTA